MALANSVGELVLGVYMYNPLFNCFMFSSVLYLRDLVILGKDIGRYGAKIGYYVMLLVDS